jgi:TolB-like protein/Flp pilus assembly protein TadD
VRFATFEVDLRAGELRKAGVRIKLYGQPFGVLVALLERAGEIVTREELQQKIWAGDTFVDFEHGLNKAINKVREALSDHADNPRFVETLPRRGYRFIAPIEGSSVGPLQLSKTEGPSVDSLAVLPLENVSGDPETEYLSDGIAETLINTLAQLRKIRVVPWTLSFRYRGAAVEVLKVGRELGVRAVLTGRMVQHGDDLTVSVELVDVERQAHLWGRRYNHRMTHIVALLEELTTEIAEKLRLELTEGENKRLRRWPLQNNEAFRLVLLAWHYFGGHSQEGVRRGITLCQQAIEIDPAYAEAYACLSFGYSFLGIFSYEDSAVAYSKMSIAAKKALELDDTLAEAHVSLAYNFFYRAWDFVGAECEARRSLELNPDSADAWALFAYVMLARGRFAEAIAAGKCAAGLAPLYGYPSFVLGATYYHAQQFINAIEQLRKAVEIDSGSPVYRSVLAQAYAAAGQRENSLEACEAALALDRTNKFVLLHNAVTFAMLGEAGPAQRLLDQVENDWKPDGISSFWIACVHACLGEKDVAFVWLEKAVQEQVSFLVWIKPFLPLARLHGDPRFDALVKRVGIAD